MWPAGVHSFFAYCLALLAGSFAIGSPHEPTYPNLWLSLNSSPNLLTRSSQLSVALRDLWKTVPLPRRKLKPLSTLRILVVALCLSILLGCSAFKPKLPAPTPPPSKQQPVFSCIDKAIRLCPGVAPIEATDCAVAVKLASSALVALEQCQTIHAELILCVLDYIQQKHK